MIVNRYKDAALTLMLAMNWCAGSRGR
ncbi:Protein of unknown function [Lactobacillus delbrueckii subsp. lactis]|nr:Protein of unknown function [Lactobacillus delbrueckii subsp. lactis]